MTTSTGRAAVLTDLGWAASVLLLAAAAAVVPFSFLSSGVGLGVMVWCMYARERLGRAWLAVYAASWVVAIAGLWPLLGLSAG